MDTNYRSLILFAYSALVVAVLVTFLFGYRRYVVPLTSRQLPASESVRVPEQRVSLDTRHGLPTRPRWDSLQRAAERIRRLEDIVGRKDGQLRKTIALLEQKSTEYRNLQDRTELALDVAFSETATHLARSPIDVQSDQELQRLRERLLEKEIAEAELTAELARVSEDLEKTLTHVEEVEMWASLEAEQARRATDALVAAGYSAVPALIDYLNHEDADLRRWAAHTLGRIGIDAVDAVENLISAKNDENNAVRDAAREALARIENDI